MKMKFLFCCAFLALAGFAVCTNSTWGYIGTYDNLIHSSMRRHSSSVFRVVTENVTFPFPPQKNNRTITAIRITDQIPNSKAYAQLYDGGIGFNHTTIHFKSERGKAFNFLLEIFGTR